MNKISIKSELEKTQSENAKFITLPFYFHGVPLESTDSEKHARWGMTLLQAGTMRFRWNETNENRDKMLKEIFAEIKKPVCSGNCSSDEGICDCKLKPAPIELIHSKIVVEAKNEGDTKGLQADGIVTKNPLLVPTVTVADCVPIFLYDKETKAIGAFHSGWKGTGIAGVGVEKFAELYGSKRENISAAIGAHIGDCCYFVDEERTEYFMKNFGENCVKKAEEGRWLSASKPQSKEETESRRLSSCVREANCKLQNSTSKDKDLIEKFPYRLSLTEANLFVLKNAGIREENIRKYRSRRRLYLLYKIHERAKCVRLFPPPSSFSPPRNLPRRKKPLNDSTSRVCN